MPRFIRTLQIALVGVGLSGTSVAAAEKQMKERLDVSFEVEGLARKPVIVFKTEPVAITPDQYRVQVFEEFVIPPAMKPQSAETTDVVFENEEEKKEWKEVCSFVLPVQKPPPPKPKPSPSPVVEGEPTPNAEVEAEPEFVPEYRITNQKDQCAALNYARRLEFKVIVTPQSSTGRNITIDKTSKIEEIVNFPEYQRQFKWSIAPGVGLFNIAAKGEDGRELKSGSVFGLGLQTTTSYWVFSALAGIQMAFPSYTTALGATVSSPWMRWNLGGGIDLPLVGEGALKWIIHGNFFIDGTSHSTEDIRTDFGTNLSIVNLIPMGGMTLKHPRFVAKGLIGYAYGFNSKARGQVFTVNVKRQIQPGYDGFVQFHMRPQSWTLDNGTPGSNLDWNLMFGVEFDVHYWKPRKKAAPY